jgi:Flp pilus assembly protein TadB
VDLLIALCAATSTLLLGLASAPDPGGPAAGAGRRPLLEHAVERRRCQLRAARLHVDARAFTIVCLASPPLLAVGGLLVLGSPVVAVAAGAAGLALPRLYLDALVRAQRQRTEAEAPRLLQVLVAALVAGRTYLEALVEARARVADRWLRDDLDHVISRFHLDVPLERSLAEVRAATAGRNLALVWDNLAVCIAHHIPAARAQGLLTELSSTVQFNVQVQQEVHARTAGQRLQIWLLAAIVPGLFLYLRLVDRDVFAVLDDTATGRYLLLPAAVLLEVLGVVLSFRVARIEP